MAENWLLEAIEVAAMRRAGEALSRSGEMERQLRILGLSFGQIIYLKAAWEKAHPREPVPEWSTREAGSSESG